MSDLTAILTFLGCLLATLGLVRVCDRLLPGASKAPTHGMTANEHSAQRTEVRP